MLEVRGYHFVEQIYDGAKSAVFRANRDEDDAPVILKTRTQYDGVANSVHPLVAEAKTLQTVSSTYVPNFCELLDQDQMLVLVYEDIGGQSLSSLNPKTKLSLKNRLLLAINVCNALHDIHDNYIVHRDINPSNIIWNRETGKLSVIDFGLARTLQEISVTHPLENSFQGTLTYIAPEQTGRVNRQVDFRTDLYSLGATLYELFTHKPPFAADTDLELVHAHIALTPKRPAELERYIPQVVSDIIMKLLEKSADQRYQTALGVGNDLKYCLNLLENTGSCSPFSIGLRDKPLKLKFSDKMYGRQFEFDKLKSIYKKVCGGETQLVLISGFSGVGKTILSDYFAEYVRRNNGIFAAGKYDQLQGDVPFSAFKVALRNIIRIALNGSDQDLADWKQRLENSLSGNAAVLTEFLPELKHIIGEQPPLPTLDPVESQIRFTETLKLFIQVYALPDKPLVIFLDDVHWIDPTTMRLLRTLLCDGDINNFLLLGAYRNDEVDDAHLFRQGVTYFEAHEVEVNEIHLETLQESDIVTLLADTFDVCPEKVLRLAKITQRKSDGNPFYIKEFITAVSDQELVRFDSDNYEWTWDDEALANTNVTSNVVNLLSQRIGELSKDTQELLGIAACIGSEFGISLLAHLANRPEEKVYLELGAAIDGQFILESKNTLPKSLAESGNENKFTSIFRFTHDRIQHAAYNLVSAQRKLDIHVDIGQWYLVESKNSKNGFSYNAVDHFNRGLKRPSNFLGVDLAALNLEAGTRAKNAAAYKAAKRYLKNATTIVNENIDLHDQTFLYQLNCECAHVAHMNSEFDTSRLHIDEAMTHTDSAINKSDLLNLVVVQQTLQGSYHEAIEIGRAALDSLGIEIPANAYAQALKQEMQKAGRIDVIRDEDRILEMPRMSDQATLMAMKILTNLLPPSHFSNPDLNNWIAVKMVNLTLQFGYAPQSPKGFTNYGSVLAVQGSYMEGFAFGSLALKVIEKQDAKEIKPKVMYAFLGDLNHWAQPLSTTKALVNEAYLSCLEHGELPYAGYTLTFARCMNEIFSGDHLKGFSKEVDLAIEFVRKTKNIHAQSVALAAHMAIFNLLGETTDYNSFDTELITETEFIRESDSRDDFAAVCFFRILQAQNLYIYGHPNEALTAIRSAQRLSSYLSTGMPLAMLNLYSSLIYAALYATKSKAESKHHMEAITDNQKVMLQWATDCPNNFLHCYLLVEGELARILGRDIDAVNHYNKAVKEAKKNGFRQIEALTHEVTGKFWREKDNEDYSRRHINRAYRHYYQWGAATKLTLMADEYNGVLTVFDNENSEFLNSPQTASTDSGENKHDTLDLEAISSASQSISREIKFQLLLDKLAKTIVEVAGADKYVLFLLDRETNTFKVMSKHELQTSGGGTSQDDDEDVAPMTLVQYVYRTTETVLIEDVRTDVLYQADPYVIQNGPLSLLAIPIHYQGDLLGVLYLENNSASGSFTTQRLETLEILSTQAAISIHNAGLYESLEQKVESRTKELDRLNRELEDRVNEQVEQIEKLNKLRRFLSPQVSDIIVSKGSDTLLKSHRKEIAIIFCDLRGFTAFSESVEPEEAMEMLTEYHQTIGTLITKYQATIDHRAGDGMMIFLNDPIPSENPVKEAVSFSIELRELVNNLLFKWGRYGHSLGFGIGISYGYATIGMIGYEGSYDYAATGRHVNLASRLCDDAMHNEILVTQRIQAGVSDEIPTEFVADLEIKGFSSKVSTYNVM